MCQCDYKMRWVGLVAHMGERRGVDGRLILRLIFRKWDVGGWTGLSWLQIGTGGGHL